MFDGSTRENLTQSVLGPETAAEGRYPVVWDENDPGNVRTLFLAFRYGLYTDETGKKRLISEEVTQLKQEKGEVALFSEQLRRISTFVLTATSDPVFLAITEKNYNLPKGTIRDILARYKINESVNSLLDREPTYDKNEIALRASQLSAIITGMDRVSRSSGQFGIGDTLIKPWLESNGFYNPLDFGEEQFFNYRRESQGVWGTMLSLKFRNIITDNLVNSIARDDDEKTDTLRQRLDVVAGSSGMAVLNAIKSMVPEDSPTFYSNTTYFEVLPADSSLIVTEDEIMNKVKKLNTETDVPLTIFLQPYSSSPDGNSNSVLGFLNYLKNIEGGLKRPINIVVDSTMVPVSVSEYKLLLESPELDNVKITSVWSLIKHGQMGLDLTMGAIAVTYGKNPRELRNRMVGQGVYIDESNAFKLLPYPVETMSNRMKVASRNTETIYHFLSETSTPYELFNKPVISEPLIQEYGNGPSFLFLPIHDSLSGTPEPSHLIERYREINEGTSYGFDKTRIEFMDVNGRRYIRIAAGQEGPLSIANTLEDLKSFLESAEEHLLKSLRSELDTLVNISTKQKYNENDSADWEINNDTVIDSRIALVSLAERIANLPSTAHKRLQDIDYNASLEKAENFVQQLDSDDYINMTCRVLGVLEKIVSPERGYEVKLQASTTYPGIISFVTGLPKSSDGELDRAKIIPYIKNSCNDPKVRDTLVKIFEDYPLADPYGGNTERIPHRLMSYLGLD